MKNVNNKITKEAFIDAFVSGNKDGALEGLNELIAREIEKFKFTEQKTETPKKDTLNDSMMSLGDFKASKEKINDAVTYLFKLSDQSQCVHEMEYKLVNEAVKHLCKKCSKEF